MPRALTDNIAWLHKFETYPIEHHSTEVVQQYTLLLAKFRDLLNRKKMTLKIKWSIQGTFAKLYRRYHNFVKIDALYSAGTEATSRPPASH